ncbi:tRNA synthetase class II (D, K and N) family protein [Actinidia rufa]|uniref:tRNA synthetase class II (D, K and N) family protein n=1 Tax=Actinidia rufa TaxID=165716 RepID=A0A7J0EUK5_9ERIC|nr:tRNA synthetase class II (D, K and N) family protein [Actinidia rufa]
MSMFLRTLPIIALRQKPLSLSSLLRLSLNLRTLTKPHTIRIRKSFSVFASETQSSSSETPVSKPSKQPQIPCNGSLEWVSRTALCGELSEDHVGKRVRLCGWVALHRIHGGLTFLNLRDHTGIVQVTTLPDACPDAHSIVSDLRLEYVISVEGVVRSRPGESVNKKMKTGMVEVAAEHVQVLNDVRSRLPFLVTTADDAIDSVKEEIRLRYRCLDLRRSQMNSNIMLRHRVVKLIRRYLEDVHGFVEVETPILCRSTPEGARDYLVPARVQPGNFFALPQSPQLYKQLLMVSSFDKYYQIARCFRDEDLRADRQPEFTQLDMEMAFTPLEDMLRLNEDLIRKVFLEIKGVQLPNPFPRLTYAEAMSRYGSDRPDVRFDLELREDVGLSYSILTSSGIMGWGRMSINGKGKWVPFMFKSFNSILGSVRVVTGFLGSRCFSKWRNYKGGMCVPSGAKCYSNTALKKGDIYNEAIKSGAKGLPFLKVLNDGAIEGIPALISSLDQTKKEQLLTRCSAGSGDLILFASRHSILWVTDFPMFEWNSSDERLEALHHPFTAPNPEDMKDLSSARALAYDMVYNGVEIGGGSLRIYKRDVQEMVLKTIGISSEQVK